jgi:hypothetical protein
MSDKINHPEHYTAGAVECIEALKAATQGLEGIEAVCTANAIKYLWRWKRKNGAEDLRKAKWYIDRLIQEISTVQEAQPEKRVVLKKVTCIDCKYIGTLPEELPCRRCRRMEVAAPKDFFERKAPEPKPAVAFASCSNCKHEEHTPDNMRYCKNCPLAYGPNWWEPKK